MFMDHRTLVGAIGLAMMTAVIALGSFVSTPVSHATTIATH